MCYNYTSKYSKIWIFLKCVLQWYPSERKYNFRAMKFQQPTALSKKKLLFVCQPHSDNIDSSVCSCVFFSCLNRNIVNNVDIPKYYWQYRWIYKGHVQKLPWVCFMRGRKVWDKRIHVSHVWQSRYCRNTTIIVIIAVVVINQTFIWWTGAKAEMY